MYSKNLITCFITLNVFSQCMTSPVEDCDVTKIKGVYAKIPLQDLPSEQEYFQLIHSYDSVFNMHTIWTTVQESLHNSIIDINNFAKRYLANISVKMADFDTISKNEIAKSECNVRNIISNYNNTFVDLVEQAKRLGKDVSQCLKEERSDITKVVEEITETITTCTLEKAKDAREMVQNVEKIINETWNLKEIIVNTLNRCKATTSIEKVVCLTFIPHEILLYLIKIKSTVGKSIDMLHVVIDEIKLALRKCIIHNIGDITMAVVEEGYNITACIHEKMNYKYMAIALTESH